MRASTIITVSLLISGCALSVTDHGYDEEAAYEQSVKDWEKNLEIEPPAEWELGNVWTFVYVNGENEIVRRVQVKITDEPVKACVSGDWRALKIVHENPVRSPAFEDTEEIAAYSLNGSNMSIMLRANICDSGYVRGELSEVGYEGKQNISPWPCDEECQNRPPKYIYVYGVPVT